MSKLKAAYKLMLTYEKPLMLVYIIVIINIGILNVWVKEDNLKILLNIISLMITMEFIFKIGLVSEMYRNFYFSRWTLFKTNLILVLQKTLVISIMIEIIIMINFILNKKFKVTCMGIALNGNEFLSYIIVFLGLIITILMVFAISTLFSYLFKPRIITFIILGIINSISFICIFNEADNNISLMVSAIIPGIITIILFYISWIVLKKKSQFPISFLSTFKK